MTDVIKDFMIRYLRWLGELSILIYVDDWKNAQTQAEGWTGEQAGEHSDK